MRKAKVKAAILTFLVVFGLAHGGWEKVEGIPTNKQYRKVQFIDPQHGWVVDGTYPLEHSNDSGKTWMRVLVPGYDILDFVFLDRSVGFVVGNRSINHERYDGTVYKTIDGGANWKLVFTDSSLASIRKIVFPTSSPLVGYFFAEKRGTGTRTPKIMGRTTDGGESWVLETEEMTGGENINLITDVAFCNADTGWVVGTQRTGANNTFLKTVDGGRSWEPKRYRYINGGYDPDNMSSVFFLLVK